MQLTTILLVSRYFKLKFLILVEASWLFGVQAG